jgi:FAD/FMN-containing dehydrogenase
MGNEIRNYDGGITTVPQLLVYVQTREQIQSILRDAQRYPGPVRAMGSYHSLTPCASSDGTIINMTRMNRVVGIDLRDMTFTAQAGLQFLKASKALRSQNLQFMTNIEIGNMTLGAAACCHTKDGLDGVEFGQVNSYVTKIKWVTPAGEFAEASETDKPDLLRFVRSSYGLCGVIYEVTFRIKPLEAVQFTYLPRPIKDLSESEVDDIIAGAEGLTCWTIGKTAIFQSRKWAAQPGAFGPLFGNARRRLWNRTEAHVARAIDLHVPTNSLKNLAHGVQALVGRGLYSALHLIGGVSLEDPDKIVDYSNSPPPARYAFTFWTFPRDRWLGVLRQYLEFAEQHFKKYGFRCNMPLGSYFIRKDTSSVLSYAHDGDVFSIDPIHAYSNKAAWDRFLEEFNEFAHKRHGIPLLNQSPFVKKRHVEAAYGNRWHEFSGWVKTQDPGGRMLNAFFAELLS